MKDYKMKTEHQFTVTIQPGGRQINAKAGTSLRLVLLGAGVELDGICGGKGICKKCKVKILLGKQALAASPTEGLSKKEAKAGWRLACLVPVLENLVVEVPLKAKEDDRKAQLVSVMRKAKPTSSILKQCITIKKPDLDDQRADLDRLAAAVNLKTLSFAYQVLQKLPLLIREANYQLTITRDGDRLLDVEAKDTSKGLYGIAFDLGTTTVVGSLIDMYSGAVLATGAEANLQRSYGADVISRITYLIEHDDGIITLQQKVIATMNKIIRVLIDKAGILAQSIFAVSVVGNTCMQHLLLGVDPRHLAFAPYVPAFQGAQQIAAGVLGLDVNRECVVYIAPNVAGYVGADTVGVILATEVDKSDEIQLVVDIGTNGEIVLGNKDRLYSCSTAAGPAFEGAQIKHGMRATQGAIEGVTINDDVLLKVIGNTDPKGICGSGLVDLVAQLKIVGIIDSSGRILPPEKLKGLPKKLVERIIKGEGGYDFLLYAAETGQSIVLTQKDIRELQLAKGAIFAGINILLKHAGLDLGKVKLLLLAGAFGNYIKIDSAKAIGLLPPGIKTRQIGNAAGYGAGLLLISDEEKEKAEAIAKRVEYIELSGMVDFQEEFIKALNFA
jgi:uncharacterized 2Fe-2S/4Fe-4S cluster protein (DUF4445 family)